jgi:polyhydroxyalkanoate synthesis repressor PhaR
VLLIKKYGNRRLYDTEASRYITLEELARQIRDGIDVQVIDAKTGHDLTQSTLAQIILEGRGAAKLLPVPLLAQLIRMRDDALADFFGRYVTWALEVYLRLRSGGRLLPFDPFAGLSLAPPVLLSRLFSRGEPNPPPAPAPADPSPDEEPPSTEAELAQLRRELEDLKRTVAGLT